MKLLVLVRTNGTRVVLTPASSSLYLPRTEARLAEDVAIKQQHARVVRSEHLNREDEISTLHTAE